MLRLGLLVAGLLPVLSFAGEFGGGVRLGISHTDNVYLVTSPDEIDDLIYQASPFLTYVHESSTLDANVQYTFDWFRYDEIEATSKYHRGEASLTGKFLQDSLQLEAGARRSQVLSDPDGVIPPGRLPLSGNLQDQDEWWVNPTLNRRLASVVTLNAGYRYSEILFDDSLAQDNTNQNANVAIENYSAGEGLTWALRYDWRRTDYEESILPWEYQQASAALGFWLNSKARIFASGGEESAWDDPLDAALADPFWEAGVAYSAGENLKAEFAAGERSFGSSWRGNVDYTFKRGSTSMSYNESPTTTGFNRGGGARNVLDPEDLDDFLDQPGNAERYISKRFQWDLSLNFRRTNVGLVIFDEDRSGRSSIDGTPLDDQTQTGTTASFSWQAGIRTEFVASGSIIDRESSDTNKSRFNSAGINVNYRLGTRSNISLGYQYSEQQPGKNSTNSQDYVANVVSLFFTYTL